LIGTQGTERTAEARPHAPFGIVQAAPPTIAVQPAAGGRVQNPLGAATGRSTPSLGVELDTPKWMPRSVRFICWLISQNLVLIGHRWSPLADLRRPGDGLASGPDTGALTLTCQCSHASGGRTYTPCLVSSELRIGRLQLLVHGDLGHAFGTVERCRSASENDGKSLATF
jgi:hypothetical protein